MKKILTIGIGLLLLAAAANAQKVDGVVGPGEYPHTVSFADGKFVLSWKMGTKSIFFAVDAEAPGWVALGFNPTSVMDQADMVFGLVGQDGSVKAIDAFSTGVFGPHPEDTALGGTNDVKRFAGKRTGNRVVFEFVRALDTKDKFDKPIPANGDLSLIWAYGSSLDFNSPHVKAGSEIINLSSGEQSLMKASSPQFLFLHVAFMVLALLFMAGGFFLARFKKTKKWWLSLHKTFGVAASLSVMAGIVSILVYIEGSGGGHLKMPHSFLGLLILALALAVPAFGLAMFKSAANKARFRLLHRWSGRSVLLLMLMNIGAGFVILGIL